MLAWAGVADGLEADEANLIATTRLEGVSLALAAQRLGITASMASSRHGG
ncbi:hypothetical protein O7626_17150 [Micromonospora sp. WMMD1102]|nr:hypothetical protein [Micromonospora sp. WMMD1102]MDG4787643.1 hypothetical protein [Micromonospora sp. WMMD1102]